MPDLPATLDPRLRALIERMTARDPVERPTAADLLKDPLFAEAEAAAAPVRDGRRMSDSQLRLRISQAQSAAPRRPSLTKATALVASTSQEIARVQPSVAHRPPLLQRSPLQLPPLQKKV
jgi:serine/threonine protein kinase